jgi:hypothetical protein
MTSPNSNSPSHVVVDWHGPNLRIQQDEKGFLTISRPPFETIFNNDEVQEITQFMRQYRGA